MKVTKKALNAFQAVRLEFHLSRSSIRSSDPQEHPTLSCSSDFLMHQNPKRKPAVYARLSCTSGNNLLHSRATNTDFEGARRLTHRLCFIASAQTNPCLLRRGVDPLRATSRASEALSRWRPVSCRIFARLAPA